MTISEALQTAGARVKPLEWDLGLGGVWNARTAFGTSYSVADSQWTYGPTMVWFWSDGGNDAAKSAAQSDYIARILSALQVKP